MEGEKNIIKPGSGEKMVMENEQFSIWVLLSLKMKTN